MIDRDVARHTKTGKNFFPTILPLESFAVQLEKKFELRFMMEKSEFLGHSKYMKYMYLQRRQNY